MNDLFGVYLGHGCLITHQFFQAQPFRKKLVVIRVGHKMESSDTEPKPVCGVSSSRILIPTLFSKCLLSNLFLFHLLLLSLLKVFSRIKLKC